MNSPLPFRSAWSALRATLQVAGIGTSALRGALYGARLGAGTKFGRAVVERLGITVGEQVKRVAVAAEAAAKPAVTFERAGAAVAVGADGQVAARISEHAFRSAATSSVKGALAQMGRATLRGAAAGAAIDAVWAGVSLVGRVRDGSVSRERFAELVGLRAARGAIAGAAGVVAATGTSAFIAATGLGLLGAPVVVPLFAMATASTLTMRAFDRRFPSPLRAPDEMEQLAAPVTIEPLK